MEDKLLRVNMSLLSVREEPFPEAWRLLGGRALSAKVLLAEVEPTCDPLSPEAKLVFAPGFLSGTMAPTSGRISVGAKSPLTGRIKEANSGGQAGQHLMRLGYRALIVEGRPKDSAQAWLLEIDPDGARLKEATALKGARNYAAAEALRARYDKRASFMLCGPAGERGLKNSTVAFTDMDHRYPTRHAARGGLGAVMASKGLKAVAIDPGRTHFRRPAREPEFKALFQSFAKEYRAGKQPLKNGTATVVPVANMMSTLPTRNRRKMQFDRAAGLDGARILENYRTRGGKQHGCLSGCIVQCSNIINDPEGHYITSALEFETLGLLGSNCEIGELDQVARLDRLCDELGLDTIEAGGAVAVAMDAGALPFGDSAAVIRLLDQELDTPLGRAIGNGVVAVCEHFGIRDRVPAAGGQGLPAWEPRSLPATAITYATSPMGADHTAGLVIRTKNPDLAQASQFSQVVNMVCDSSGFCQFQMPRLDEIRQFLNAMYAVDLDGEGIYRYGFMALQDEWEFNRRAGFTQADNDLPAWMRSEPVPSNQMVYQATPDMLAKVYQPQYDESVLKMRASG
jgi:aldehyde:ferredoxin oxidoreductase